MVSCFTEEAIATRLFEFDVTRPEDLDAAATFCHDLRTWLDTEQPATHQHQRMWADLLFMDGMLQLIRGDLEQAIESLQSSIDGARAVDYERRRILSLRSLAVAFEYAGMQKESTRSVFEAMERADHFDDIEVCALVSLTLGMLYQAQGAWDQLLECATRTHRLAEQSGNQPLVGRACSGMAVALGHLKRSTEAFEWLSKAEALAEPATPVAALYLNINRQFLLIQMGDTEHAAAIAEQNVPHLDQLSFVDAARVHIGLAQLYLELGRLGRTQEMLERAEAAARGTPLTAHLLGFHTLWAKLLERQGDETAALAHLRQAIKVRRDLKGVAARARLVEAERYFAEQMSSKMAELHHLRTVELVEKNQQLADLVQQKDEILHVVVHDLRNPLAAAQLLGESLVIDLAGHIGDDAIERLGSIIQAAAELGETIDALVASLENPRNRHIDLRDGSELLSGHSEGLEIE